MNLSNYSDGGYFVEKIVSIIDGCSIHLVFIGGCSSKNIQKVDVYEMDSFSDIKKDSLTSFTDSKVVNNFIKAFNNANTEPGLVDIADPEYKWKLEVKHISFG